MNTNQRADVHGYATPLPHPSIQHRPGHPTAAWIVGTVGVAAGLIPILFVVALPAGIVALALGVGAWRAGRRHEVKQGKAGTFLGAAALVLGVVGLFIVQNAFDTLEDDLDQLDACIEADQPEPGVGQGLGAGEEECP